MNRRSLVATAALIVASVLSSCATISSNDEVASVDERVLSQDDLQAMLESELGQALLNNAPVDGMIQAESARSLINAWVQLTALSDAGIGADVDTAPIVADLEASQPSWATAPQIIRDLATKNLAIGKLIDEGAIDEAALRSVMADADISVDSRYGWWDAESISVAAFA